MSVQIAKSGAPIAFLLAGIVTLLTGYSYAKLSRRFPSYGGTIEYIVKAYGTGLLSGSLNILLLLSYIIMISLYAYAFGAYGAAVVGGDPILMHLLIVLSILVFTVLNALGAKISGITEELLVGTKIAILIAIGIGGLVLANWARLSPATWPGPVELIAGGMIIFLAYEGFELIANTGADIENPRDLPRAFYISILAVIGVYILISIITIGNLNLTDIVMYRDYALAMVAKPIFGSVGFALVVIAALVSTSSAINATLYGTARASYMVAKLGEIPKSTERRIWKESYEGLLIISGLSLIIANLANLETISTAGSGGFLLIFTAINIAAFKLSKEIQASRLITGTAAIATFAAFSILIYHMAITIAQQAILLIGLIALSFILEWAYRMYSSRAIRSIVDRNLLEKERNVINWRKWVPSVVAEIHKIFSDSEVYIVGKPVNKSPSASVDLIVFTNNMPKRNEEGNVYLNIKSNASVKKNHPFTITYFSKSQIGSILSKYSSYKKLSKA